MITGLNYIKFLVVIFSLFPFLIIYRYHFIKLSPEEITCEQIIPPAVQPRAEVLKSVDKAPSETISFKDLIRQSPTDQNDPRLLKLIQSRTIAPSPKPYHLHNGIRGKDYSQYGTQPLINRLFNKQRNGVFVEAGAFDGETMSASLHLEINYKWTGLLVEPNQRVFRKLLSKNRKAYCLHGCISSCPYPQELTVGSRGLGEDTVYYENRLGDTNLVECYPLYSLLSALNFTTVDLFILDIEGFELNVLRTLPFSRVNVKVWIIEWNHINKTALDEIMFANGYRRELLPEGKSTQWLDGLYIKNPLKIPIPLG